jgi:hypothetical protein
LDKVKLFIKVFLRVPLNSFTMLFMFLASRSIQPTTFAKEPTSFLTGRQNQLSDSDTGAALNIPLDVDRAETALSWWTRRQQEEIAGLTQRA